MRKDESAEVARLARENERLRRKLALRDEAEQRRFGDLSVINELGGLLAQHLDLSAVLSAGVRSSARIADVPHAFLLLHDGEGHLRLAATVVGRDEAPHEELVLALDEPSAATYAMLTGKPVVIHDVGDPRLNSRLASRFGHVAVLAVPLIARGEPVGSMVFGDTRQGRRFAPTEIDRAVAMSNQLATGIANARLYERELRRVEELKLLLDVGRAITASLDLEHILEVSAVSVARLVDASDSFMWLIDPKTSELIGVTTAAPEHREHFRNVRLSDGDSSLAAHAVATRAPVQAVDASAEPAVNEGLNARYRCKSLLALPLMLRGEPIGSMVIGDRHRVRRWTPGEIERATVVVAQVAVAVANARLFDDLRRSYEELEKTQQALVERERLAAIGELAARVAHEVRNPLAVIWNSLVSLRRLLHPSGDVGVLLDIVREESGRLNEIVGDLLDFARPHAPVLHGLSLDVLVAGALDSVRASGLSTGLTLGWEPAGALPMIVADARWLHQAVVNLLTNAIQATPPGGKIVVRAGVERDEADERVWLDVTDEGCGIQSEIAGQIFLPFFTTRAMGTGLGLAVVKRIVEAHAGNIFVARSSGEGTTLRMTLPIRPV
jgi:signal transduction histidine kinase